MHINEETLDRYALGALSEDEAAALEEHMLGCEACQSLLRRADDFAAAFRVAAVAPDARPARGWWPRFRLRSAGLATAAAMAAGVLFVATQRDLGPVAPAVVALHALRGPESPAQVPAGKPAWLTFDIASDSQQSYTARIVDLAGAEVVSGTPSWKDGRLGVTVAGLRKGSYWVRVYRQGSPEPIVEYGIEAR
jgi:hypothetical protein